MTRQMTDTLSVSQSCIRAAGQSTEDRKSRQIKTLAFQDLKAAESLIRCAEELCDGLDGEEFCAFRSIGVRENGWIKEANSFTDAISWRRLSHDPKH